MFNKILQYLQDTPKQGADMRVIRAWEARFAMMALRLGS